MWSVNPLTPGSDKNVEVLANGWSRCLSYSEQKKNPLQVIHAEMACKSHLYFCLKITAVIFTVWIVPCSQVNVLRSYLRAGARPPHGPRPCPPERNLSGWPVGLLNACIRVPLLHPRSLLLLKDERALG